MRFGVRERLIDSALGRFSPIYGLGVFERTIRGGWFAVSLRNDLAGRTVGKGAVEVTMVYD